MVIDVTLKQANDATSEASIRQHRVLIDRPVAKGGHDEGPMGGELLLAALGGCFMSNLLAAIKARQAAIHDVEVLVSGTLAEAPSRFSDIRLEVRARHDDTALLQKLVTISERACIVANTLRGDLEVGVSARDRALS